MDQSYYILRTDHKATYFGQIVEKIGDEVTLANARRLWHWSGAYDIAQLAQEGVKQPQKCRFTTKIPAMTLLAVREIIPATEKAAKNIMSVPDWEDAKPPF